MNETDIPSTTTRAALLTPPGPAGIAVVRLAGPGALALTDKLFRPQPRFRQSTDAALTAAATPHTDHTPLLLGAVIDDTENHNQEIVDQVIINVNRDEQFIDINCHGGPRIIQRLLMLLQKHDVKIIPWQELTLPNTIADEITHTLPLLKTRRAVTAVAAQHPAGLAAWRAAAIDTLKKNSNTLPQIKNEIEQLLQKYLLARKLITPSVVVITGPVNAGKSTLANALTGRTQSLASDLPGTTRDWTAQLTDIEGIPVELIDTAGRRPASDYLEQMSLSHADQKIVAADLIILVLALDPDSDLKSQLQDQLSHLPSGVQPLIAINKTDLPHDPAAIIENACPVSALTGQNLDRLRRAIAARLGFADFNPLAPLPFTPRQQSLLHSAAQAPDPQTALNSLQQL